MSIVCQICRKSFTNNLGGQLTQHVRSAHFLSLEEYVIQVEFAGKAPICACGLCENRPVFYRGKFKRYAFGHDSFEKREQLYIAKFGAPTCLTCKNIVGFHRGQPKKFCSFVCQGKQNGFSKPSTQKRIQEVVQEKYGVSNVSELPEVRKAISESNVGRAVIVSSETKEKHSQNSKKRWADPVTRAKMCSSIRDAVNTPEERQRRSEFAKTQMNDVQHVRLFFGSGFGHLSKLHRRLRETLQLDKFGFVSEQPILPYIVDELCASKKIVIEINGDYIHANPKKYSADDIIRIPGDSYTAAEKWERDAKKKAYLESKGYCVFVIWESDDMGEWRSKLNAFCSTK